MKCYALNDGRYIPWLAFGTGTAHYGKNCTALVSRAIGLGITHLDGAQAYENEESLGDAVDTFLGPSGTKDSSAKRAMRDALYITTKLEKIPPGQTVESKLRASLENLRVDYVDLFLVHNPRQHVDREDGLKGVWREMVEVKRKGLTRSIGVSNFNRAQLEEIIALGLDVPSLNQIEYHPFVAKRLAPLIAYQRTHNILLASFGGLSPIIPSRFPSATTDASVTSVRNQLLKTLDTLGDVRGATSGQVLLKWLQAEDAVAVTTSSSETRLKEYLDAENMANLTTLEMKLIEDVVGDVHFRAFTFVPHLDEK